jgi:two-component system sensor histidine kinase UhpB
LLLTVTDNGKGITEKQISNPESFGLIGMRERAHNLNGEFHIRGIRGTGTRVAVKIPVENP